MTATQLDDFTGIVLDDLLAFDDVAESQPYFSTRLQAEELARSLFEKIILFDPEFARERNLTGTHFGIVRMIHGLHYLHPVFRIVGKNDFQRPQDSHAALRRFTQLLANTIFEHAHFDELVFLGHTAALDELAHRGRRVATPAHTGNCGHARIVPTRDDPVFDQHVQLALARDRIGEIEPGELYLAWPMFGLQLVEEPVIQRPMILELERAERVCNSLERVGQGVRKIVHRVDAPLVARALMRDMADSIQRGVTQVHIRRRHIDLGAQYMFSVFELAGAHAPQHVEALIDRPIAIRAVRTRLCQSTAVLANLFRAEAVDVSDTHLDQCLGRLVKLIEIVRRVREPVLPVESEPVHVALDRTHVLLLLLAGVRVIEAQERSTVRLLADTEVQADRHYVADVQITVRLGRKSGHDLVVLSGLEVLENDLADKIPRRRVVHM